jgi:uncharacterized membrane protein YfcA
VNVLALFSLLSCVVVAFQGSFVLHRNPRNALNRIFFLLCLSAAYLAFVEFQFRQAESFATAYLWLKASALWAFVLPLELHFVLLFTERTKLLENRLTYLVLYVPALIFFLKALTRLYTDFTSMGTVRGANDQRLSIQSRRRSLSLALSMLCKVPPREFESLSPP